MSNSILMGGNFVTEEEVFSVPPMPFTRSHKPIHHKELIRVVKEVTSMIGLEIRNEQYVLEAKGNRMFAIYDLDQGSSDLCWTLGLRNSLDKSVSVGFCAGTKVFVCSNLAFSGEVVCMRRHSGRLDIEELEFLAFKTMRSMIPLLTRFQKWHEGLREYPLPEADMKILLVEIMTSSVIPPSKFNRFNELYGGTYDSTLWGFHEAVTDILKGSNQLDTPKEKQTIKQRYRCLYRRSGLRGDIASWRLLREAGKEPSVPPVISKRLEISFRTFGNNL